MTHSIRFHRVDWLHRILNKVRKGILKHLRGVQVEPQASANVRFRFTAEINDGLGQGQVNHSTINGSTLNDKGWNNSFRAGVNKFPVGVPDTQLFTARNHNFISHQNLPQSIQYIATPDGIMRLNPATGEWEASV